MPKSAANKNPKQWDRCLYCDASIKGEDATDATLHDPYCPHGKALRRPTGAEIQLASVVAHLIEYIDTGEPMDLQAADGIIGMLVPNVLQPLYEKHLVPLRRDGGAPFAIKVP